MLYLKIIYYNINISYTNYNQEKTLLNFLDILFLENILLIIEYYISKLNNK